MKTLKFRADLVEKILKGEKTITWRIFDDEDLTEGDEVAFINLETKEEFATAVLTSVRVEKLGELAGKDFDDGSERYENPEDVLAHYREYYGDKVGWDTELKIVRFKARPN